MEGLAVRPPNPRLEVSVHIHGISNRLPPIERFRFEPASKLEGSQKTRGLRRPETPDREKSRHRGAGQLGQSSRVLDDGSGERVGPTRSSSGPEDEREELGVRERTGPQARQAFAGPILRVDRTRERAIDPAPSIPSLHPLFTRIRSPIHIIRWKATISSRPPYRQDRKVSRARSRTRVESQR